MSSAKLSAFAFLNSKPFRYPHPSIQSKILTMSVPQTSSSSSSSSSPSTFESANYKKVDMKELLRFSIPTIGLWLMQPIQSLVDTGVLGMSSNLFEFAALGPGIAWIDETGYLLQFMGIATTNLYSTAIASGSVEDQANVLSEALVTSIFFGILLCLVQFGLSQPMVALLSGPKAAEVIPFAVKYSRIRSVASLVSVPSIVAQASLLARRDSVTPLYAVLIASAVNVIADFILVVGLNKGIAGAAWATTVSQFIAAAFLAGALSKGTSKVTLRFPKMKSISKFLSFCGPLFLVLLVKVVLWVYTIYATSTAGAVNLASHQILITIFLFFVIFGDVLSQCSQTYLPGLIVQKKYAESKSVWLEILKLGCVSGVLGGIASCFITTFGTTLLTKSPEVINCVKTASLFLGLALIPHSTMAACEGTLMALTDSKFLACSYGIIGSIFILLQNAVRSRNLGVVGVWAGMAVLAVLRLLCFGYRSHYLINSGREMMGKRHQE